MKAAIYCRVSTEDQEREGTSLQTQLEACLKYCQDKGYEVAHRFSEAYSGLTLERYKLNELRELARAGDIDVIVVYCLDRLSRDPTHGVILTQEFEKHNVKLEAVTEDVDNSELGKLISYIRGFASKLETEKIRERTMRGKKARALSGRLPSGTGRGLYGYHYMKGKGDNRGIRIPDEEQAKWVREMYRWLVEEQLSINAITTRLRALGVPTPSGSLFWIRQTVYRILTNPAYIGKTYAFCRNYVEPKRRLKIDSKRKLTGVVLRPRSEWVEIPDATPAIISEELFTAAQEQLRRNKELAIRNQKRQYLLSGYVFCRRCGRRYEGYVKKWKGNGKRYEQRYYRCARSQRIVDPVPCDNRGYHAGHLERAVWEQVETLLSQPELVLGELNRRQEEAKQAAYLERDLKTLQAKLENRLKQKDRIYRAFYLTGDEATFKSDVSILKEEIAALEQAKADMGRKIETSRHMQLDAEAIKKALELVKSNVKTLSFEEKRLAFEALQIKVLLDSEEVVMEGAIPKQDSCFVYQSSG